MWTLHILFTCTRRLRVRETSYCIFIFVKEIAQTELWKKWKFLIFFPVTQSCHNSIKIVVFQLVTNFLFTKFLCYSLCFDFSHSEHYRDPQAALQSTCNQPLKRRWLIPPNLWVCHGRTTLHYHTSQPRNSNKMSGSHCCGLRYVRKALLLNRLSLGSFPRSQRVRCNPASNI